MRKTMPVKHNKVIIDVSAQGAGKGKPSRNNRRRRGRRGNQGGGEQNAPGVVSKTVSEIARAGRNNRVFRGMKNNVFSSLPLGAREFVHRHLNPCGEYVTLKDSSKVPDGAIPNSAIIELREAIIVRPPNSSTASVPLDGSMWTLTIIHTPMFRTPLIMVASMSNAEMSEETRELLKFAWNVTEELPEYPNWVNLDTDNFWCVVKWTALKSVDPPTSSGASTSIQQFRITADGMTMYDNTPDLINQGMVIGAQWNVNSALKTERTRSDLVGYSGPVRTNGGIIGGVGTLFWNSRYPILLDTLAITVNTGQATVTSNTSDAIWQYAVIRFSSTVAQNLVFTVEASHSFVQGAITVNRGDVLTYSFTYNLVGATVTFALSTPSSGDLVSVTAVALGTIVDEIVTIVDELEMPEVTAWQLPPTDTQNIIQSTPKAVYMSAKEQNGIYMVKRVFQPVFNMQEANNRRQVVIVSTDEQDAGITLAPSDVFDANYGIGVVVWSSIPTSCSPAIKLIRDVEIVAGMNGPFTPFMMSCEDKCEPALEIVRAVSMHHPMMYPESYNALGGLMNIINGVVGNIPILGNVVGAVLPIVKSLLGSEMNTTSGASQNRLASTNVDELSKLADLIKQQLRI